MKIFKKIIGFSLISFILSSCGQMGPLYLPDSYKTKENDKQLDAQKQLNKTTKDNSDI